MRDATGRPWLTLPQSAPRRAPRCHCLPKLRGCRKGGTRGGRGAGAAKPIHRRAWFATPPYAQPAPSRRLVCPRATRLPPLCSAGPRHICIKAYIHHLPRHICNNPYTPVARGTCMQPIYALCPRHIHHFPRHICNSPYMHMPQRSRQDSHASVVTPSRRRWPSRRCHAPAAREQTTTATPTAPSRPPPQRRPPATARPAAQPRQPFRCR